MFVDNDQGSVIDVREGSELLCQRGLDAGMNERGRAWPGEKVRSDKRVSCLGFGKFGAGTRSRPGLSDKTRCVDDGGLPRWARNFGRHREPSLITPALAPGRVPASRTRNRVYYGINTVFNAIQCREPLLRLAAETCSGRDCDYDSTTPRRLRRRDGMTDMAPRTAPRHHGTNGPLICVDIFGPGGTTTHHPVYSVHGSWL